MRDVGTTAKLKYDNGEEWERVRAYTYATEVQDFETGAAAAPYFSLASSAYTIPADTLDVGTILRIRAGGEIDDDSAGGLWQFILQITTAVGTPNFGLASTSSSATPAAGWKFYLDVEVVITATGNPVSAMLSGYASIGPATGSGTLARPVTYVGSLTNIDSTATNYLYVNFGPGSSAANEAYLDFFSVEITAPRT